MIDQVIEKAINIVGSQKKLAMKVGVSQPNVWSWLHRKKKVSPERVHKIVRATEVKAHQIRPDLPELFPPPKNAEDIGVSSVMRERLTDNRKTLVIPHGTKSTG
ncbi:helix-turn-helix domain-containing protein [Pantoea ananatis]|uniref:transcriptional regulator n=1 Tax=Pantoea ananas TaxID=553 RepID=UPI001FF0A8F2|nr:helix-turn-helix domain-containing protein [Pantoea ananatis]